jgi:hypothetical protein
MGGGTSVVEALAAGRRGVGCDLNELAVFVARAKTTPLTTQESASVRDWAEQVVPTLSYRCLPTDSRLMADGRTRNLELPRARPIKKVLALALDSLSQVQGQNAQAFVRCVLLNAGQWALNGRLRAPSLAVFRDYVSTTLARMLEGLTEFERLGGASAVAGHRVLINASAADLPHHHPFLDGARADLVVTSPPYPGIHVLYHRWQVDGRHETPAPYWLANCQDGQGAAYYTFVDRRRQELTGYFAESLRTLRGIRAVMKPGAYIVQMVAFADANEQLPRYLATMREAGFAEDRPRSSGGRLRPRIWRPVPGRKWHAVVKGETPASKEVVLVHRAS